MWHILSLVIMPAGLLAQPVPSSLASIELDRAKEVLELRNNYNAPAVNFVVAHRVGSRYRQTRWFESALAPAGGEPLAPGDTFKVSDGPLDYENWDVLAVIFADGTYAGSREVIQSIMQDHQIVSEEIEKAIGILSANPDAQGAIESWFQDTRKHMMRPRAAQTRSAPWVPGVLGTMMAEMSVPRFVRQQLRNGAPPADIVESLRVWQTRLQKYKLEAVFV